MADSGDSSLAFFTKAAPNQWSYVLSLYKDVLSLKAALRTKKGGPEELIRLDTWYQEQLPKQIHARKDKLLTHEELVQIMKWKLMRGKFRPRLIDLVKINTERAVKEATKKAFKKIPNISSAISALTTLKGIGPATASAVLAAGFPEHAPYMADESMLATPGIEATDYTLVEYLNYAEQIQACCKRLQKRDPEAKWTAHKVELTLWTHYLARDMKPALLDSMPAPVLKETTGSDSENSQDTPDTTTTTTAPNGNSEGHKEGSNGAGPKVKILIDEAESSNSSSDKIEASDESSQDSSLIKTTVDVADNNNSDELQEPPSKKICV